MNSIDDNGMEAKYPEHEKLSNIKEESQTLGAILEWMNNEKGYHIAEYVEIENYTPSMKGLHIVRVNINTLLAEYYDIDLVKLEKEKQQMLDQIRVSK